MIKPDHQDEFYSFEEIIERERDEGLAFFRSTDFELRLKMRLETDIRTERSCLVFLKKPVLVLSALAMVCCAAAVIIYQILSPSPHEKSVKIIEELLLQSTYLQEVLAEATIPGKEQKSIATYFEEELACWQNPKCRKKFFSQILNVFKEVRNDTENIGT